MKRPANNKFLVFYFMASLVIPAYFGLFSPHNSNSLIEKRRLAHFPQAISSAIDIKRWKDQFEKYYQDHFGLRYSYLFLYRHIKYFIGDLPADLAILGKDKSWIFYNKKTDGDIIGDYRNINKYSQRQLQLSINYLKAKQQWLASQGIEYLFVLAPSKHYIYPEKLPLHISKVDDVNITDQLANELKKHPSINFLHLQPILQKAKTSNPQLLYFKADSHWNFYGANRAQYEIAKSIENLFPNKIVPKLNFMEQSSEFTHLGDHSQYLGIEKYFAEKSYRPILDKCTHKNTSNEIAFNETFTTQCSKSGLTVLVYRDSFFTNLQPFISSYFQKATFIWSKLKFKDVQQRIIEDKPDLIIEEWVDRFLPNTVSPK